jgi:hypothetical protein
MSPVKKDTEETSVKRAPGKKAAAGSVEAPENEAAAEENPPVKRSPGRKAAADTEGKYTAHALWHIAHGARMKVAIRQACVVDAEHMLVGGEKFGGCVGVCDMLLHPEA